MTVTQTKVRWYFSGLAGGSTIHGFVEFAKEPNGPQRADIYNYSGTKRLWSTLGVRRASGQTAKRAFEVYVSELRGGNCVVCLRSGAFAPNVKTCLWCGGTGHLAGRNGHGP